MVKKVVVAIAAALLAAGALPARADDTTRLTIGVVGDIDQPLVAREIRALQYPTLTALAADTLDTIPGVADEWTTEPSGFTYTIRDGATWSDGTPVTTTDVEFSLIEQYEDFEGRETVVRDERRVTIPNSDDPALLLPILPAHAYGTDETVAGGSWHVAARTGDTITMQAVATPGRPPLDEIVFRAFADTDALLAALANGDIDVAGDVESGAYDRLRRIDGVNAIHANDGDQWILQLRIDDVDLRRTIARAIDRDRLAFDVADDVAHTSPIPVVARGARWRLDDDAAEPVANQLRYDPGARDVDATVTLRAPDGQTALEIASFLDVALEEAGITVEITDGERADLTIVRRDPADDPTTALQEYTCTGGIWCDDGYDAAFATFSGTRDTATRLAAVQEMVELLATEAPEVVLFEPDTLQGYRTDNVTGLLREPADERLVVFWPSVEQYSVVVPTATLGGEDIPDIAVAAIGAGVVALAAGIALAVRAFGRRKPRTGSPA